MDGWARLLGREQDVDAVARALYAAAGEERAPVVGAMQLTCSDESERECIDAFQHGFAEHLLPTLKLGERSVFRIANLGGRYEQGAVHIAEDHYSTTRAAKEFKLLLVKINSHVSADSTVDGTRFGQMGRYDTPESTYCGALHALMGGDERPFATDLRAAFSSGDTDRVAPLLDPDRVNGRLRSLFAAVVNSQLQGQRVVDDIRSAAPRTPTLFVIVSGVTLNRKSKDTEIVCGVHRIDHRSDEPVFDYEGLGDDPLAYRLDESQGSLILSAR